MTALEALRADPRFLSLAGGAKSFNIYRVLQVHHSELEHSNILAALLDPRGDHELGCEFLRTFLRHIGERAESALLQDVARVRLDDAQVLREMWKIDLVIDLPSAGVVIGVENKVFAGEQPDQVRRYQASLAAARARRIILFLTPAGRQASTADPTSAVPCIPASWVTVIGALRAVAEGLDDTKPVRWTLREFARHLEDDVTGTGDTRDAARALWIEHREAINRLLQFRPKLEDISDGLVAALRAQYGDNLSIAFYPAERGDRREVKVQFKDWKSRGLELTMMLYLASDGVLSLRLLIWAADYKKSKEPLERLARAETGLDIDPDFLLVPEWGPYWRRVLRSGWHVLQAQTFDGATIAEVVQQIGQWREAIEGVSGPGER